MDETKRSDGQVARENANMLGTVDGVREAGAMANRLWARTVALIDRTLDCEGETESPFDADEYARIRTHLYYAEGLMRLVRQAFGEMEA